MCRCYQVAQSHWHWTDAIDVNHVYLSENLMSGILKSTERCVAEYN